MNLQSLLTNSLLSGSTLDVLSEKTGLSKTQLKAIIAIAIPLIIKYMTSNASSESGANSLLGALTQHTNQQPAHQQLAEADTLDGASILGHIFGNSQQQEMESVAQQTGTSAGDIAGVLSNIAPLIMSGLSAATTSAQSSQNSGVDLSDGFDLSDVFGMLGGGAPAAAQSSTSQGSNGTQLLQTLLGMMK